MGLTSLKKVRLTIFIITLLLDLIFLLRNWSIGTSTNLYKITIPFTNEDFAFYTTQKFWIQAFLIMILILSITFIWFEVRKK